MKCPNCKIYELADINVNGVEVHTCRFCHGFWLTKNELEDIKDRIPDDAWLNLDLWNDKKKLTARRSDKICPVCNTLLCSFEWDNSNIIIEMCGQCNGIWLNEGGLKKIIEYIKKTADLDILEKYWETLKNKVGEVFNSSNSLKHEMNDLWTVLNMFKYKFMVQNPNLAAELSNLPTQIGLE